MHAFDYCLCFNFIYLLFLANYCDLEASQTAADKEGQQQMLKRIERAKDVQIFNLQKELSHASKQHAVQIYASICNAVNFTHVIISACMVLHYRYTENKPGATI